MARIPQISIAGQVVGIGVRAVVGEFVDAVVGVGDCGAAIELGGGQPVGRVVAVSGIGDVAAGGVLVLDAGLAAGGVVAI